MRRASTDVFRADLVPDRSIALPPGERRLQGQRGHAGNSSPPLTAATTLLRYRAYIDPPGYVPNWLARSTFRRELPQMLTGSAPTL